MPTLTAYRRLLTQHAPQPIRTAAQYKRALAQLESLMTPRPDAAQGLLIELWSMLIEAYEATEHPTPALSPAELLSHLLETRGMKPADLARATHIPPATISNVLARRRNISQLNARRLGNYFGVSPLAFLGGPV